ncbi:MAG: BLUF domain-containing protein, partial [Pseudomonadota bacterium]
IMKLNRLIYRSTADTGFLKRKNFTDLLSKCNENNELKGINGLLLLSGGQFLQVLEGPSKFLNELYKKIINDDRHHNVRLLYYEAISEPSFPDWNMRLIELDKVSIPVYKMMLKKYPNENGVITFPENKMLLHSLLLDTLYFANLAAEKARED